MEFIINEDHEIINTVNLEVGLKLELRDCQLKIIQEILYIKENFKLNIKRINRWWYSVYFDKKDV